MKIILFANTDWYLYNFRMPLAKALKACGHEVVIITPSGDYVIRLQAAGFRWIPLQIDRRSLNPFREIMVIFKLIKIYNNEKPDAVHHFTIKSVIYGAIAATLTRIPARINAVAGLGYVFSSNSNKAKLLKPLVRFLFRFALNNKRSILILQNPDDVRTFSKESLVKDTRIQLIMSSGVNTTNFQPTKCELDSTQPTRVLLAARLLWCKGIAEYMHAARVITRLEFPIHFYLAGAPDYGNPDSVKQQEIDNWISEGVVKYLGHVENMRELFNKTDIMVLPSYYGEGIPKSLIEAAACGLAIVTTDSQGCREVVTDGVNGLLIPIQDSDALQRAILRLHKDPELRKKLGLMARQRAIAEFEEKIIIEKTLEIYSKLLNSFNVS